MPSYKLHYFNTRGLGEMFRVLFAEAGVHYEDIRYSKEEWPNHKPDMLFNTLPVLFVNGEQIAHSRAAFRYLAREFKLDGGSSMKAARVDMWLEAFFEAVWKLPMKEENETKKADLAAIALKDYIHPYLNKFEDVVKLNGGLYAFGNQISALDIAVFTCMELLDDKFEGHFTKEHPILSKLMQEVASRTNIKKWLTERPVTE